MTFTATLLALDALGSDKGHGEAPEESMVIPGAGPRGVWHFDAQAETLSTFHDIDTLMLYRSMEHGLAPRGGL